MDVEKEEVPTKPDTTFLVAPAPAVEGVAGAGVAGMGEALVVFCIDISGSMCVTTEVRVQCMGVAMQGQIQEFFRGGRGGGRGMESNHLN